MCSKDTTQSETHQHSNQCSQHIIKHHETSAWNHIAVFEEGSLKKSRLEREVNRREGMREWEVGG